MAIFDQKSAARKEASPYSNDPAPQREVAAVNSGPEPVPPPRQAAKESLIAADLAIEGKIEGAGNVRIAGKFKGDVKVQGNLTIEQGAKVSGGVAANKVTLAGELDGNIASAQHVELLQSGVINGDLKAGSLTVAAGSRIRGHVECGWSDKDSKAASVPKTETGSAA